jgi:hypothetical protein
MIVNGIFEAGEEIIDCFKRFSFKEWAGLVLLVLVVEPTLEVPWEN